MRRVSSIVLAAAVSAASAIWSPTAAAMAAPPGAAPTSVTVSGSVAAPHSPGGDRDRGLRDVLQRDVDRVHRTYDVPGALVHARTSDGSVRVRAGVADTRTGVPMPWKAHFRVASFTKTFVAATVLQLVDEGLLGLDEPVETYLPGLVRGHGNDGRRITVRQVLQHTSGLPDYIASLGVTTKKGFRENRFDTVTGRDAVKLGIAQKSLFAPGTQWGYSNTNYALAGLLIKKVTGTSWREQVEERIIEPLDLSETSVPYTSTRLPSPHARGYERFLDPNSSPEDPVVTTPLDATRLNPSWAGAAGAMISTTADGNRFLRALVRGRVLSPEMLAEMQTTVPVSKDYEQFFPGGRYGLGLFWIRSSCGGYWSHGGDIMGFMTRNGVTADGERSVMVSYNTDSPVTRDGDNLPTEDPSATLIDHALCGP